MQNDFIDGLVELSLRQVNRIPNHIGRLLDLIFVFDSSDAEVSRISALSLPEDCYHPTLHLCINGFFNNPRTAINVQPSLCFKRTDYGILVESLSTVSWSFLVDLPVDDAVRYFYEILYRLFDEHVPLSSMKNSYSSPWFTRQLSYLMNKKPDYLNGSKYPAYRQTSPNIVQLRWNLSSTILIVTKITCLVVSLISKVILSFSFLSSVLNGNLSASLPLSFSIIM